MIFQAVLSIAAGADFIAVGIYFLSSRFLAKLNEASAPAPAPQNAESKAAQDAEVTQEAVFRRNAFRAKGSGYTALALGALTLAQAFLLFSFPAAASALSLVYLSFILIAVIILVFVFK